LRRADQDPALSEQHRNDATREYGLLASPEQCVHHLAGRVSLLRGNAWSSEQDDPIARVERDPSDVDYHIFRVTAWDGELRNRAPEEHAEIRWFSVDDAKTLDLASPAYREIFALASRPTGV
jgi:8-oxo-dGTP pyrophosphatase MutT (NUDIX family)